MDIKQASAEDQPEIKQLIFSSLREYGLRPDSNTTDSDLDDIKSHYFDRGGYFGVIKENDIIVATVALYKVDETTCELRKMYISARQRGRGLGKRLLEFALGKARNLGFKRMTLETATVLVEAIGLYKRYGFKEYKAPHLATRCDQAFELWL
ncbi:MAG: GNAT family N-acetyltransferase [Gammaproteobacteria bacterium]|nr:GNAT family N-acetyltransferase [Gammaproteobacteria bacterium]